MTGDVPLESAAAERAGASIDTLREAVRGVLLGQDLVLDQMLVTLLAGGHALLQGLPGMGKTLAIRALSRALDADFGRIQFTPDLMPADITGVNVFDESTRDFRFLPGPVFTDLLLADEINRSPAKTQSALLEAMQERQVTVDGETRALSPVFSVFASQNPLEVEGTYPLPEAQLDRFTLRIDLELPPREAELRLLDRTAEGFDAAEPLDELVRPVLDARGLAELRATARQVHVQPPLREWLLQLVEATREEPLFVWGASPRASVALFRAAQAQALLDGRGYVVPEDVRDVFLPVMRHRLRLVPEAEMEDVSLDARLTELAESVAVPR